MSEERKPIIIGSKKGGGGGATEASDTLFARHKAAVLDVVSEGEIVGLVDGASSIFFNETRIRDKETLEYNFKGVETIERYGTQDQDIPKRFLSDFSTASVTQDFSGNGKLELNTPQYLKITTGSIERSLTDYLKISIFTDAMYKIDKKGDNQGDTTGTTVSFDIDFIYTTNAGVQTVKAYQTGFNGKCSSKYVHTFGIDVEAFQPLKDWEVKITRVGGDISSAEYKVFNNIYCGIIESQITDKLEYPLTAYIGTKLDAEAFGTSIPKRSYDLKGVKISVPTNYFASDVSAKKITLASATNFAVGDSISSNFSISTLTSDDAVNDGLTATATCASAHGIPIGQIWRTTISGVTVGSGTNYYNGTFDAVATTATKFKYQMSLDPDDDSGGGTMVGTAASGTVLSKSSNDVIVRDISNRFVLNSTVYDTANHSGNSTTISAIADNPINFASYTRNVSTGAVETTDQDWDGNFYTSWTDNPAWVYYDLLTNKRYGLGSYIDGDDVDKWELFSIAKYCDELVPDPTDPAGAATEPRFTCNLYLTKATEAYKVLQDLAAVFRGMQYWINGTIVPVQDREKDPVYQFTDANVINGSFEYEGSARKTRHNMAKVTYNNPNNFHKQTIEYIQDAELLSKEGSFPKIKNIVAFGCTSRGQALRLGKWVLTSEKLNYETIKFKTGLNASFLRPGDIINVLDARRQGVGWAGRVLKPTTTSQLVTNGTFGSGISSWTQGTATQSHDTSNKRIKLTSGGSAQTPRSYQSLGTLTSGRTYRVKARAYHGQTADSDQYAKAYISTATNGSGEVTSGRTGTYRTNSATETYIDFTIPAASTATHYLQIEGSNLDNTEFVTFDSIEVYEVNTTTSVRLDRDVVIASGKTYTLTLTKPGYAAKLAQDSATIGSTDYERGDLLSSITTQEASQKVQDDSNNNVFVEWSPYVYAETKTVNTSAATVSTLGVSSAFSKVPDDETIWILQRTTTADELKAQQYTILGVSEDGEDKFDITGLKYNASKFDFVDKREELETHRTINAPTGDHVIPPPTSLRIVPAAVKTAGTLTDLLSVAWSPPKVNTSGVYDATTTANNTIPYEFTKGYEVRLRTSDHEEVDWQMLGVVTPAGVDIIEPIQTTYNFQIRTVNMNNMMSTPLEGSFVVTPSAGIEKTETAVSGVNTGGTLFTSISLSTSNVSFGSNSTTVANNVGAIKTATGSTLAFAGLANSGVGYVFWDHSAATITAKVENSTNNTWYTLGGSEWTSIATDTVACTAGSEDHVLTGTNTTFTSDFTVGSKIRVDDEDDETYTIDTITSDTVLSVIEPIFTTQTTASIKKQSFIPDKINDVILATITENSSGNAWTMEQHCQTPGVQGAQGATGEGGYSVKLEPSKHVISYSTAGVESTTVAFTTTPTGIAGTATYTFQVDSGSGYGTATGTTAGQSSGSFTLVDAQEPAAGNNIIVKVILYDDGVSKASDTVSIYGVQDGTDAITIILTNDSHTIPTDLSGANGTYTGSGTDIKVWRGATALAYHASNASTFSIGTPDDTDITVGSASTVSTYTRRYAVASAFTTGTSTKTATISFPITVRDAASATTAITKIQTFSKSLTGATGATGAGGAAGNDGSAGVTARAVNLTMADQTFEYNTSGLIPSPSNAVVTATALNTTGTVYYEFFKNDSSVQNTTTATYTYTPPSAYGSMPEKIEVQIREGSNSSTILARDQITASGLQEGSDAFTTILTNEAHTLPVTTAGTVTYTGAGTDIDVWQGTTHLAYGTGNSQFVVAVADDTNITVGAASTVSTYSRRFADHSSMTADTASITYTITAKDAVGVSAAFTRKQTFAKSHQGATGATGTGTDGKKTGSGQLYYQVEAASAPDAPSNSSVVFTFATGAMSGGVIGTSGTTWNITPPTATGGAATSKTWFVYWNAVETTAGGGVAAPTFDSTVRQGTGFNTLVTFANGDFAKDGSTITTIDGANITTGAISSSNLSGTSDGSDFSGAGMRITLSNGAISAKQFRIASDGTAAFKGALSAASGTFGGALSGGTISIGSSNSIFKADSNGIYLGNATFGSAPFRVTPAGAITSTSGTIGGWTLASTTLSATGITIDSTNKRILIED